MLWTHPERRDERVESDDDRCDRRSKYQNRGEHKRVGNRNAGQKAGDPSVNDPVRSVRTASISQSLQTSREYTFFAESSATVQDPATMTAPRYRLP